MNLFNPFSLACCDNLRFCSVVSLANLIRSLAYTQRGCCTPLKFNSSSPLKRDHLNSSRHPFFRGNSLFIFWGSVWWVLKIDNRLCDSPPSRKGSVSGMLARTAAQPVPRDNKAVVAEADPWRCEACVVSEIWTNGSKRGTFNNFYENVCYWFFSLEIFCIFFTRRLYIYIYIS